MGEGGHPNGAADASFRASSLHHPRSASEWRHGVERTVSEHDERFLRRAIELAERGAGLASPNPMVGAVVVRDGGVVGEGWHEGPGTRHAEIVALAEAGKRAGGATLYVTLEPCSHFGRTPPCAPAVVEAGISRVVASVRDPNPIVDGAGFRHLENAGVEVVAGVLEDEGRELILGFAKHVRTGLPFVTLKMAASLDGRTAARDGSSRWITGEEARRDVHRLRSMSDAVMVGSGTALADDPSLTVRLEGYRGRQPLRVVVDGRGRMPATGALFDGSAPTLIATTEEAPRSEWEAAGAEVLAFAEDRVPLVALVESLGKRGVQSLLIEGGPTLAWAAVEAGVVDRIVLYLAPKLIGGVSAPGVLGGEGIASIADAIRMAIVRVDRVGEDLKVVADVHRDR
jgi:diaminohydroxyphosphoribosylaminopyrimidine deaminase/5-amino-6-(5-phosphoribosylamino)uracil reductase